MTAMENLQIENCPNEPLVEGNTATKEELLQRAKDAIEANDHSLREAAEALAVAQEAHGTSQAEMARAVGKSAAWVSHLLQWRRNGFKAESPFGPTTKAERLQHAEDRIAAGASTPSKPRKPKVTNGTAAAGDTDAETSPAKGAETSERALAKLKDAIDHLVPLMDPAAKKEAADYLREISEGAS
jgi:hypothetical protein